MTAEVIASDEVYVTSNMAQSGQAQSFAAALDIRITLPAMHKEKNTPKNGMMAF